MAVGGRQVERVGDLAQRLRRQPAMLLLGEAERGQGRRLRAFRIAGPNLLDGVVEGYRSTSPITVSSEPTIAIMSAIKASCMQVAVASSATNDGARNLTRHGFGPPSETT